MNVLVFYEMFDRFVRENFICFDMCCNFFDVLY